MRRKIEVIDPYGDNPYILAYGLLSEDDMRAACIATARVTGYDWEPLAPAPVGGIFEWGAFRWLPQPSQDDYPVCLAHAWESESGFGQFFGTLWYPARWILALDEETVDG